MKNSYNIAQSMLDGGIIGLITNKKVKASKRYLILIGCILFYLVLIALCFFNGIGNFGKNMFLFIFLNIIGIVLAFDLLRLMHYVEIDLKQKK